MLRCLFSAPTGHGKIARGFQPLGPECEREPGAGSPWLLTIAPIGPIRPLGPMRCGTPRVFGAARHVGQALNTPPVSAPPRSHVPRGNERSSTLCVQSLAAGWNAERPAALPPRGAWEQGVNAPADHRASSCPRSTWERLSHFCSRHTPRGEPVEPRVPSAFPLFRSRDGPVPRGRATAHGVCLLHQMLERLLVAGALCQHRAPQALGLLHIARAPWPGPPGCGG